MTDQQSTITVTREDINAALVDQHRAAQEAVQPLLEENNRLRAALRRIAETGPPAEYERIAREALGDV